LDKLFERLHDMFNLEYLDLWPLYISLKVALVATFFTFFIGLFAARKVVKMKRLSPVFDGIFTLPMVLPPTVVGFFLLLIFGKNSTIGGFLSQIDLSPVFTWYGAVIAASVVSFPLMYRTARGAMEQMDQNLVYAARTLGIGETKIFWRIIMPSCWPGIASGTVLTFARAMGEFGATTMIAGNIPKQTQTLALAVYSAMQGGNRQKVYYWVVTILLISFAALFFMNHLTSPKRTQKRRERRSRA